MKPGDLVKMKYIMFWQAKNNPRIQYTEEPFLVLENVGETVMRLLDPRSGRKVKALVESYEVVSAA